MAHFFVVCKPYYITYPGTWYLVIYHQNHTVPFFFVAVQCREDLVFRPSQKAMQGGYRSTGVSFGAVERVYLVVQKPVCRRFIK